MKFKTKEYSHRSYTAYGWTSWSSWEKSDMYVTMDLNTDVVTIYSPKTQYYQIIDCSGAYYNGTTQCVDYHFYDQDGDRGTMTLAIKSSGRSELYIRFRNLEWCYWVVRIN